MNTVNVIIGLPGYDAKTIIASESIKALDNPVVISFEDYKEKYSYNKAMHHFLSDINSLLTIRESVIVSGYNVTRKSRRGIIEVAKKHGATINATVITTSAHQCLTNLESDTSLEDSPEATFFKYANIYEFPQIFEGFDNIKLSSDYTGYDGWKALVSQSLMIDYDLQQEYPTLSLKDHSDALSDIFSDCRSVAAIWHDIGKIFVKKIDNNGIAHYPNYANISVVSLLHQLSVIEVPNRHTLFEVLFYINEQEHIKQILKSDKAIKKYSELFGTRLFENLVEFMYADNLCSTYKIHNNTHKNARKESCVS